MFPLLHLAIFLLHSSIIKTNSTYNIMYSLVKGVVFWQNEQDDERHVDVMWGAVWGMIEGMQDGKD